MKGCTHILRSRDRGSERSAGRKRDERGAETHNLDRGSERSAGRERDERGAGLTNWGAGTKGERSVGKEQEEQGAGLTAWGAGTEGVRGQQAANRRNKGQDSHSGEQGQRE